MFTVAENLKSKKILTKLCTVSEVSFFESNLINRGNCDKYFLLHINSFISMCRQLVYIKHMYDDTINFVNDIWIFRLEKCFKRYICTENNNINGIKKENQGDNFFHFKY